MTHGQVPPVLGELYIPILLGIGLLILMVSWLPLVIKKAPLSLPIVCVGIGAGLFLLPQLRGYTLHPVDSPLLVEKATELIVIVSLMGAGLKIDHPLTWRGWRLTWRLLAVAMPITIAALTMLGMELLGIGLATALLLGTALSPTDPVLASDVQIECSREGEKDETRFALTAEAGLNDGFAFPFIHLAILAAAGGWAFETWREFAVQWVFVRIGIGLAAGIAGGWLLGRVIYRLPGDTRLSRTGDGFVALGATLSIYALTEVVHGYGFFAVFVAGIMLRRAGQRHDFNDKLHAFADETERLLMMGLLVLFGGMLTAGDLLSALGWPDVAFALAAIFLVRPVAGWIALAGLKLRPIERGAMAFFGIRGLGSVYYFAYGVNHGVFDQTTRLWGALGLVILLSILLHGISVTPVMRRIDRARAVDRAADVRA